MTPHDWTASAISIVLVLGIMALVGIGREVPPFLINAFFFALSWATRGAVNGRFGNRHPPAPP